MKSERGRWTEMEEGRRERKEEEGEEGEEDEGSDGGRRQVLHCPNEEGTTQPSSRDGTCLSAVVV